MAHHYVEDELRALLMAELLQNALPHQETAPLLMVLQSSQAFLFTFWCVCPLVLIFYCCCLVAFFFSPRPEMNELLCFPNICHCSMWLLYLNCLFRVAISLSKSESAWNHTLPHPHELLPSWCEACTSSCGPEGTKKNQDCK